MTNVMKRSMVTAVICSVAMIGGCAAKPATTASGDAAAPGAAVAIQPSASHATASPAGNTAEGPVVETMDAANYTYVKVKTASGEIWAATSTFKVAVGDRVTVPLENPMENFHSQTLKRDFPVIYFTSRIAKAGESLDTMPASTGAAPAGGAPMQVTEAIPPAPGGVSVASVVNGRKAMGGKTVTIRGKVVKYNGAILGFNWLHIQDGSGDAKDGSNDITVTSSGVAKVGDIVTITGTVVLDKDFGAGYSYAVLLQNATVTVK